MFLEICMQIYSVAFALSQQIKQKHAKTINLLCAGNKVFVKCQAQGGGVNTHTSLLQTPLNDTILNYAHCIAFFTKIKFTARILFDWPLPPLRLVAFEFIIGHNSWTDCTRLESHWRHSWIRKTAIDPMNLKKGTFTFEIFEKNANFWFSESNLSEIFQTIQKNFVSRFPVSSFEVVFWLGLCLKTPTNKKFQPKWVITVLGRNIFWVKKVGEVTLFPYDAIRAYKI